MTRTLGLCLLTLMLLGIPAVTLANHSANAADEQLGVSNGAQYAMFVPAAWNGRLVLWAYGFVDPDAPIALPDALPPDVAPWLVELRESLLAAGYAVAYSSYAENGWAVKDGAERTHELQGLFRSRFGIPTQVYVGGRSLGALITAYLAETHPADYQGALAMCGPLGGGRLETDYIANVRVLFDFFFPGVIPGDVVHVPPMEYSPSAPVVKAIVAAILAEPHKAVQLASVDQIELPYRTHTELLLYDPTVNAGVGRFVAQPGGIQYLDDYYRPHGTLSIPLLTLHTTMDPDVPFFHEAALAKIVADARTSKWLAQQSVQRCGHCNVTPAEVMLTLGRLVNWAEHGVKPASGDVTAQLALESPQSGASTGTATVNTEFGFTKVILSGATGVPLP